ncbi:MAG: hypothetical protein AAF502_14530 [Bacteroidota bacterium]
MKKFRFTVLVLLCAFFWCCSETEFPGGGNCSDGVQNQGETGVDCGGPCTDCGPSGSDVFFYGNLDGQVISIEYSNNSISTNSCGQGVDDYGTNFDGYWLPDPLSDPDTYDAFVSIVTSHDFLDPPNHMEIYDLFLPGAHPFGSCPQGIDGAEIAVRDNSGNYWFSNLGDQSGSTFEITFRDTYDPFAATVVVEGTFSCKVYTTVGGAAKTIDSGMFRMVLPLFI